MGKAEDMPQAAALSQWTLATVNASPAPEDAGHGIGCSSCQETWALHLPWAEGPFPIVDQGTGEGGREGGGG